MTPVAAEWLRLPDALTPLIGGDAAGLAALICWLHEDAEHKARLGQAGMSMVCRHFSKAHVRVALAAAIAAGGVVVVRQTSFIVLICYRLSRAIADHPVWCAKLLRLRSDSRRFLRITAATSPVLFG
jgi:hypothetical protein